MDTQKPAEALSEAAAAGRLAFPIVGIGASAGGFPALATLLQNMPASPGMALVVILHLAAGRPSSADRILQGWTAMPVALVDHAMPVLPDQVYLIPPGCSLKMQGSSLVPEPLERPFGDPDTIDVFFRSLARVHKENAVGVVLSGMGSDGTAGLARIKEWGGVAIAQVPADAEAGSMPQSAIESGMADFVLTAAQIPGKLVELQRNAQTIRQQVRDGQLPLDVPPFDAGERAQETLEDVLSLLQAHTGHDFRQYRHATLMRRLERRLQVRGLPDLPSYCRLLHRDLSESRALLRDLLTGVTSFFRDPDAFDALGRLVLPALLRSRRSGGKLRAWVAACATGEEAYTLAMLLADQAAATEDAPGFQVIASDIDADAVRTARKGLYPAQAVGGLPAGRIQRCFTVEDGSYRVRKTLRERILFAEHNLLRDPPFSRMDLITCRNFLVNLNLETQRQVLGMFHFALNAGGFLMLGSAETADAASELFSPVDGARRLYQARRSARKAAPATLRPARQPADLPSATHLNARPLAPRRRLFSVADIHLRKAAGLAPPTILVDGDGDIVHIAEDAGRFLHPAEGEPSRALAALVAPELRLALRTALYDARHSGCRSSTGPVRYRAAGADRILELAVLPFHDEAAGAMLMLVSFLESPALPRQPLPVEPADPSTVSMLEEALRQTRRRLQATIDQAEASGSEMRTAIEELQTMVVELQAANEDLRSESAGQASVNEELKTVNRHLQQCLDESAKAHDDFVNLVASSDVASIFLDRAMRIQRYTPRIAELFKVIPADVGRSLLHIASRLDRPQLAAEAASVFDTRQAMEREVRGSDGRSYIVRVHPYRTADDRVEGAVMSFFDITERRAAEDALRESAERLRAIYDGTYEYIGLLSPDGTLLDANRAALEFGRTAREDVIGRPFWDTVWFAHTPGAPDRVREAVGRAARGDFVRCEVPLRQPSGEVTVLDFSLHPVRNEQGEVVLIVPECRDVDGSARLPLGEFQPCVH